MGLVSRFFTDDEASRLRQCEKEERLGSFYELWTLKESFLKAVGNGLSAPLNSFELQRGAPFRYSIRRQEQTWHLRTRRIEPDYVMSICVTRPFKKMILTPVSLEEIVSFHAK
jgi:4'-phosphopantetheinyl transferase